MEKISRRSFFKRLLQIGAGLLTTGTAFTALGRSTQQDMVWQIDPHTCVACGRCSSNCVLTESAVKCVHAFAVCGYCDLCSGFFKPNTETLNTGAENRLCPTGAIKRTFIEDPYYQYTIDEKLCIACGLCIKGCSAFGNGSLFLQIRHDRCANCNQCSIARNCPSNSIKRISSRNPYILKGGSNAGQPKNN